MTGATLGFGPAFGQRDRLAIDVGIPVALGFLFGWLGAEPLGAMPKGPAIVAGILTMLVGWLSAELGTRWVAGHVRGLGWPFWLVLAAGTVASGPIAVPGTFAVRELVAQFGYGTEGLAALADYSLARALEGLIGPLLIWTSINLVLLRLGFVRFGYSLRDGGAPAIEASPDALLSLLKPHLRGPILAVQAEQHYIRIFTARGDDLVLHRFGEAVRQLESVAGAQVHRSWWVARAALACSGHPLRLQLTNGVVVPVGRTYMLEARRAGLIGAA